MNPPDDRHPRPAPVEADADTDDGAGTAGPDRPLPAPGHEPVPIDLAEQSIAGEEDPGAAFDDGSLPPQGLPGGD